MFKRKQCSMMKPALVVLAAGVGSRYGGFKQIDPVGPHGEVILDYSIYDAWRSGFGKVVFVIQPNLEAAFREHFEPVLNGRMTGEYVYQDLADLPPGFAKPPARQKPWGTAHAVWSARHVVQEAFGVINADDFYGPASYRLLGTCLTSADVARDNNACMVAFQLRNTLSSHGTVSRGICTVDNGFLVDVVERTRIATAGSSGARFLDESGQWQPLSGDEAASMNMWGFSAALFGQIEKRFEQFLQQHANEEKAEFFIPSVVDSLIKSAALRTTVVQSDEKWFGMTYREDREEVQEGIRQLISRGAYPENLWKESSPSE